MRAALHLLPTVLNCAHGYKEETKFSHLSSQEGFGASINFVSRYNGCIEVIQVSAESKGYQR